MLRGHREDTQARKEDLFVNPHNIVAERLRKILSE